MTARNIAIASVPVLAAIPIAATIWLQLKRHDFSRRVLIKTQVGARIPSVEDVKSLPQKLYDECDKWVLSIERASKTIHASELPLDMSSDAMLVKYLRANMISFTYTPQAPLLRRMCGSPDAKATFEHTYLQKLNFDVGDRVCGVFTVVLREDGRIEMAMDPPAEWTGPKGGEGRLVARLERRGDDVVFFNGEPVISSTSINLG